MPAACIFRVPMFPIFSMFMCRSPRSPRCSHNAAPCAAQPGFTLKWTHHAVFAGFQPLVSRFPPLPHRTGAALEIYDCDQQRRCTSRVYRGSGTHTERQRAKGRGRQGRPVVRNKIDSGEKQRARGKKTGRLPRGETPTKLRPDSYIDSCTSSTSPSCCLLLA